MWLFGNPDTISSFNSNPDNSLINWGSVGTPTTLLRAAGFEAYAGMTMAGSRVEQIPADQFNHCITAVREPDGSLRILDPTWIPLSPEMWSSAESEQNYVIGTKEGETLQITPLYGPDHNRLQIRVESRLGQEGELEASVALSGMNYADQRLRRTFYDRSQSQVPGILSGWAWALAPGGRVTALRYDPETMTDYSRPAEVGFDLECAGYAVRGDKVMAFTPVAAREFLDAAQAPFLGVPLTPERRQDLLLWCTRSIQVQEKNRSSGRLDGEETPSGPTTRRGGHAACLDRDRRRAQLDLRPGSGPENSARSRPASTPNSNESWRPTEASRRTPSCSNRPDERPQEGDRQCLKNDWPQSFSPSFSLPRSRSGPPSPRSGSGTPRARPSSPWKRPSACAGT